MSGAQVIHRPTTARARRHRRIRKRVVGTSARPRLCVFRSHKHLYAQLIDDWAQRTLLTVSTLDPALRAKPPRGGTVAAAERLGHLLAERTKARQIQRVVFDRAGYQYHGRVQALAEAARAHGLEL